MQAFHRIGALAEVGLLLVPLIQVAGCRLRLRASSRCG
jgi:hypothetical protein